MKTLLVKHATSVRRSLTALRSAVDAAETAAGGDAFDAAEVDGVVAALKSAHTGAASALRDLRRTLARVSLPGASASALASL